MQFFFTKITIFIFVGIVFCAKDSKKAGELAVAVFKFIYNNEKLCGDIFGNSSWLPARHSCELRCRMDTEICQMSGEAMPIRRQRCHELPAECRRHLKKLLGGAELYTKPNKRLNPALAKQRKSSGATTNTKNALKAHVKPLPTATNPSRQIRPKTSPVARKPPIAELAPLVKDLNEILIHPAQFHTTTSALPIQTRRNVTRKSLVKPLPTLTISGQPPSTSMPRPRHVPSPVDDSLPRMFEQLYIESGSTTVKVGGRSSEETNNPTTVATITKMAHTGSTVAETTATNFTTLFTTTSPITTTETTATTTTTTVSKQEWQSAEMADQPFAGNPFVAVAANLSTETKNVTTNSSSSSINNKDSPIQGTLLSPTYKNEVFGPPLSQIAIDRQAKQRQQQRHNQLRDDELTNENTSPATAEINKPKFADDYVESFTSSTWESPTSTTTSSSSFSPITNNINKDLDNNVLKMIPKTMEEVDRRQIPWWHWRKFGDALRQRPIYQDLPSSPNAGDILLLDKSVRCCHWALEGLCDRSWQRFRELCPKSCGSLICSSIDGTLSCTRAINVDVIACYEQRRRQQNRPAQAQQLTVISTTVPSVTTVPWHGTTTVADKSSFGGGSKFETETNTVSEAVVTVENEDKRAFAVEKEMKMFMESTTRQNI
ncbi:hypothetical protein niasHS_006057 [Heterodera schachtii]|uniref:ShKT domain-containing protein n=1 Tax=Heterodera schachtii TaxID=97005 RepID=A0ABD2JVX1_HETSC